jgi:hypothetical protein
MFVGLAMLFFTLGYLALQEAKPQDKNSRVYPLIEKHMPYYLEKRVGGFSILKKGSREKEKPPIKEVYNRLQTLQIGWAKTNMKLQDDILTIYKDKKPIDTIKLNTQDEIKWVQNYFDIKN